MATVTFSLPDLGEGLIGATVIEWLVEVGQEIELNHPMVEVETEKGSVEIPSPVNGTVVTLHAGEGEAVTVGAALITFETADQAGIVGTIPTEERPTRRVRLRPPGAN